MFTLLAKHFINEEQSEEAKRNAYGMLSGIVGIFLNLCLFLAKCIGGVLIHSVSMTADAVNNLSDAASSIVTLLGFRLAAKDADSKHPYGHGRLEYIAGLAVSSIIVVMAFELGQSSVQKILSPTAPTFRLFAIVILVCSILVKFYMYRYNAVLARRFHSPTLKATATDSLGDCLATTVVLLSLGIYQCTGYILDGYAGVFVACFILKAGIDAAGETIHPLLGQAPEATFVKRIEEIVLSYPEILGMHDLLVHDYGPGRVMISLHAEVPADGDFVALHEVIDAAERALQTELHAHAVIHMDPVIQNNPELSICQEKMCALLTDIDPVLSLHDFRIVSGASHKKFIFDVLAPFQFAICDTDLIVEIESRGKTIFGPESEFVITIDKEIPLREEEK